METVDRQNMGVGKMRNCGMRNVESKCGIKNAERRWLVEAANHVTAVFPHITATVIVYIAISRVVKCRPEMRKMQTLKQECIWYRTHTL